MEVLSKKKNANGLNQYYTNPAVAKDCIDLLNSLYPQKFKTYIEPSAGAGAFYSQIEGCIGFDLEPKFDGIEKADFLSLSPPEGWVKEGVCVIGNPPFGKMGSLALEFIKKSFEYANVVAFILPLSFSKDSFKKRLPKNAHLVTEIKIQEMGFILDGQPYNVPCVFQVWEIRDSQRDDSSVMEHEILTFSNKDNCSVAIRRVGSKAGKATLDVNSAGLTSFYFVNPHPSITPEELVEFINSIDFSEKSSLTVAARSISKVELIEAIRETIQGLKTAA